MSYQVLLSDQAREFLSSLDEKSRRIVSDNLKKLAEDPYPRPSSGRGDREKITWDGREGYRLHISRTYTALYTIHEEQREIRIQEILTIQDAHKRYGE